MNLADMLSYADIHQLNRIANHYACDCNTNSKRELIQSILNTMNRNDVFERYVEGLTVEDIRFLDSIVFDRREAFSLEELLARAKISRYDQTAQRSVFSVQQGAAEEDLLVGMTIDLKKLAQKSETRGKETKRKESRKANAGTAPPPEPKPWSPRDMIVKFAHQGWLFNGYSHHTKYLYQVPSDLKKRFSDSLAKMFQKQLRVMEEPPVYRDEQGLLVEDIGKFLSYLHRHEVELTSEGTMYKRSQQAILELLNVKEELVGKGGWRFGYGRKIKDYPNRFSLIYDYCYYSGYISESVNGLELTDQGEKFVAEGRLPDPGDVYQFWLKLYKNPIHNVQSIVQWIDRLAGRWVTLETLTNVLRNLIKPYYYDSPESILKTRIVVMLMHQGMLRIGEHPQEGTVVEMTRLGSSLARGVYVPEEEKVALPASSAPEHMR